MNPQNYPRSDYLSRLALQAGEIMLKHFQLGMEREWKSDNTPVTLADTAINEMVVESLRRDFPHVRVIGEEGSREVDDAEYTVFCDPVDGTISFSLGVPVSAFCIAVVREQLPLDAVIYDPFNKRLWHASRGHGAFLNDKAASVSQHESLYRSYIWMNWWKGSPYNTYRVCDRLIESGAKWICSGSIAYFGGMVASGQIEATIFPGQKAWETAAMQLMVEEAGGKVTDIYGNEMRYGIDGAIEGHIISNGLIHSELVRLVRECQETA